MVNLLALTIISGLTNWRISSMLYSEQMFNWLRRRLGVDQTSDDWYKWIYPDNFIGSILGCFWCLSLVISTIVPIVSIAFAYVNLWEGVLVWLSGAAIAIIVEKWIGRSKARI